MLGANFRFVPAYNPLKCFFPPYPVGPTHAGGVFY